MTHAIIARQYGEPSVLEFAEIDSPEPGPHEVKIAVRAVGVNPTDYKQLRGPARGNPTFPLRIGNEASGVVIAVGADAVGPAGPINVGDEVIAFRAPGSYAEEVVVPESAVLPKPAQLSWEKAAGLLLVAATAFHLVEATGVKAGDRVLVHGASGSVGLMATQLAVLRGATVVGTASATNQDLVREHGAEPVVYGEGLADRVRALFPDGVDVALDTVGTDEALDTSVELVADRHRIATIAGWARGPELGILLLGGGPGADPGTELRMGARAQLIQLAADGKLDVLIAKTFPLSEAAAALELVATGHPGGKVVLLP